ncbi:tail fiber assembly protein, partial [Escherichia coli]
MKMPAFEWVHVQLHQQKGMISLSPPTICNSADDTVAAEFMKEAPEGKYRGVIDGMPAWIDIPPPTHEEQIAAAELEKQQLINQVNEYIN